MANRPDTKQDRRRRAIFAALAAAGLIGLGWKYRRAFPSMAREFGEPTFSGFKIGRAQRNLAKGMRVSSKEAAGVKRLIMRKGLVHGIAQGMFTPKKSLVLSEGADIFSARHELGHSIWSQLPRRTRVLNAPRLVNTKSYRFYWDDMGPKGRARYPKDTQANESFAELYGSHRGRGKGGVPDYFDEPYYRWELPRYIRRERNLLAKLLRAYRRQKRNG